MRRVLVLALLALALPMAVWADGIDIVNLHGNISISLAGITSNQSQLYKIGSITASPGHSLGRVNFSTGVCLSGCDASGIPGNSATFSDVGSSFDITSNGHAGLPANHAAIFTGAFTGPIEWALVSKNLWTLTGSITGQLWNSGSTVTGTTVQTISSTGQQLSLGIGHIRMGNTNLPVPEPGTLGLLGTGLVGIAGVFRHKFMATK